MISKKKSPSKIKYNYEKDTIHKSSIYIYILSFNVNINNFDTWKKKKQTFGCAACFAGGFFFSSPIQPEKHILYPEKLVLLLFESCFNYKMNQGKTSKW